MWPIRQRVSNATWSARELREIWVGYKFVGSDGSGDGVSGGSDIIILEGVGFGLSSSATMRRKTLKAQW